MSELKIVPIGSNGGSDDVKALLKEASVLIEASGAASIGIVIVKSNGEVVHGWNAERHAFSLIGGLFSLQSRILRQCNGEYLDDKT